MRFDVAGAIVSDVSSTVFASEVSKPKIPFQDSKKQNKTIDRCITKRVDFMVLKDFTGRQAHCIYISHGKETTLHWLLCIVCSQL